MREKLYEKAWKEETLPKYETLPKHIICTDCKEIRLSGEHPAFRKDHKLPAPTSPCRKLRQALHHHKNPIAYRDAPLLEDPCPLCFFRRCRQLLRTWIRKQKKPFSAVTVQIDRLTSEQYEENVSFTSDGTFEFYPDLGKGYRWASRPHRGRPDPGIWSHRSGPRHTEKAVCYRLVDLDHSNLGISKYGNAHRQLRALILLDGLIQNAGSRFQKGFADEPLLERLRLMAKDDMVDKDVRAKVNVLFRQWAAAYKGTPGLERIATLYKELPRTRRPQPHQSRVVRENDAEAARENASSPPESPTTQRRKSPPRQFPQASSSTGRTVALGSAAQPSSSLFKRDKKDKKNKGKPFNLEREKGQLLETIASATVASNSLMNALQLINREVQRVGDNPEVSKRFETCKLIRRQILRYIQLVESEQYIGSLLNANDELVKALMAYEIMDKSIDDDSDSENEDSSPPTSSMAGMSMEEAPPAKPPRPMSIPMPPVPAPSRQPESEPEEDDDDPFGDSHGMSLSFQVGIRSLRSAAVKTPHERGEPTWRDV